MTVTLDSKRRLTLPASLLSTKPGQVFDARYDVDEDAVVFRRLPPKEDWIEVLAQCPIPMDDLPARRRELPKRRKL
jgi:bifunctional DNA-binding transcriptional regulator/antitoxin component of YhaV-PrlF toxin-antitoxin module